MIDNDKVRVIDASTAHRVAPGWTYGFPEMTKTQRAEIAGAPPGRPTRAAIRPASSAWCGRWSTAGLVPADFPLTVNAISGYSGGGTRADRGVRDEAAPEHRTRLPHLRADARAQARAGDAGHAGLTHPPLFAPVGRPLRAGHDRRGAAAAVGPAGQAVDRRPARRARRRPIAGEPLRRGASAESRARAAPTAARRSIPRR